MNKKVLVLSVFTVISLLCLGCGGNSAAQSNGQNTTKEATMSKQTQAKEQNITIEAEGQTFEGKLTVSPLTEKLIASLPKTIAMEPFSGRNQIYGDTPITVKADLKRGMKRGTLAYCQYGYLILFYADQPENHTSAYVKVGEITTNLDKLPSLGKGSSVKFALKK